MSGSHNSLGGDLDGGGGLIARRPAQDDPHFDITAMIDLVFMMNIYFLFTFIGSSMEEIDLPAANHASALEPENAIVFTVLPARDFQTVNVYIGNGSQGQPISDPADQEERIGQEVDAAIAAGKKAVLIKAEKKIRLRDMSRIALAATREGVTLHLAVLEKDTEK